jgi:hypothetical protein
MESTKFHALEIRCLKELLTSSLVLSRKIRIVLYVKGGN